MGSWDDTSVRINESTEKGRLVQSICPIQHGAVLLGDEEPRLMFVSSQISELGICDAIDADRLLSEHLCAPEVPAIVKRSEHRRALRQCYTNAFVHNDACVSPGEDFIALYWNISMINHSCSPNAMLQTRITLEKARGDAGDGASLQSTEHVVIRTSVVATRPIADGEEITIAYQLLLAPRHVRQSFFEAHYGFVCTCARCYDEACRDAEREALLVRCPSAAGAAARRLEKLFCYGLDPLSSRTTLSM
jgi:hypothetical protein